MVLVEASKTKRRRASLDVVVTGEATRDASDERVARDGGGARARARAAARAAALRGATTTTTTAATTKTTDANANADDARTVRGVPGRLRERDDDEVWTRVLRAVRASGDRAQRDVPDVSEKGDEGAVSSRVSVSPGAARGL